MPDGTKLIQALEGGKRLLIYLHDSPDPDAMAAGWLLKVIAESQGLEALMLYGGILGRAENRAMVRVLDVPVVHLDAARLARRKDDRHALVDTRPGAGNNSFPHEELEAHVVVDHHLSQAKIRARFADVRLDEGCSTTLVLQHFDALGLELTPPLATAALYAIISETQDLDREASRADRLAYQRLISVAQLASLGKIRHPSRDRGYYRAVARAMSRVMVGKNTCVCHMGALPYPEVVAEMADFLVAMQQISWSLVTGLHGDLVVLSIRTTIEEGQPDQVMKKLLGGKGKGGGHGMIAGGAVPGCTPERYRELTEQLTAGFLDQLGRRVPERLRPLLEEAGAAEDERG